MASSSKELSPRYSDPSGLNAMGDFGPASQLTASAATTTGTITDHSPEMRDSHGAVSSRTGPAGHLPASEAAAPRRSPGNGANPQEPDQSIYLEYTLDRRQRLTAIIAPFIAVLAFCSFMIFSVFLATHGLRPSGLYMLDATIGLTAVALVGATLLAHRGYTNLAASVTVVSISAAIVVVQLLWILARGIDPYGLLLFTALDIAIVLVGVLGTV